MELRLLLYCFPFWLTVITEPLYGQTAPMKLPAGCNSSLSQNLRDDLFTASSTDHPRYTPSDAMVDREGWYGTYADQDNYLQLDFERQVNVTGLRLIRTSIGCYTKDVSISYSQDGLVWKAYNSRLSEGVLGEKFEETRKELIEIILDPTIKAQYIALTNPTSLYASPCMRLEVFGCNITNAAPRTFITKIEGNIQSDVVWIPSQSPIVIDKQITVGPTASVTIKAGVTVVFTSTKAGMNIYGKLESAGIAGLEAVFTSSYPVLSARDRWKGLKKMSAGNLTLVYSTVRQAVTGVMGNGKRLKLKHCLIYSCTNAALLSSGMEMLGEDSFTQGIIESLAIFTDTVAVFNQYGLKMHGLNNREMIIVHKCTFSYSYRGVVVENWDRADDSVIGSLVVLHESVMSDNTHSGFYFSDRFSANIVFLNTSLSRNRDYGIYTYIHFYSNVDHVSVNVSIINTSLTENSRDVHLYCHQCDKATYLIKNSTFVQSNVYIYHYRINSNPPHFGRFIIVNNTFTKSSRFPLSINTGTSDVVYLHANTFNATKGGMSLSCERGSGEVFASITDNKFLYVYGDSAFHMRGDNLKANFTANKVYNSTAANLIHVESGVLSMSGNNFTSNIRHACFVKVNNAYDGKTFFEANYNYWGTSEIAAIKSKICDFYLDSTKIPIRINAIFNTSDMKVLQDTKESDNFQLFFDSTRNVYVIGGIVTSDTIVDSAVYDYPVLVNRSILIPEGFMMTLSRISVSFAENRGVAAHGSLHIGDKDGTPTVIQVNVANKKWNGVQMFSSDILIQNTNVSGSRNLLDYRTAINARISNSTVYKTDKWVSSENHNGDINITIASCNLDVTDCVLYLDINSTQQATITVTDSIVRSRGKWLFNIKEHRTQTKVTDISLSVKNCSVNCDFLSCIYVHSCSSYLEASILDSIMSAPFVVEIQTFSANLKLHQSVVKDHLTGVYIKLCNSHYQKKDAIRKIEISGNSFQSARIGTDISMFQLFSNESGHEIYIVSNTFKGLYGVRRKAIEIEQERNRQVSDFHSFFIENNIFSEVATAFGITGGANVISVKNNTCQNGKEFIYAGLRTQSFGNFSIHTNTIRNNTENGIVKLFRSDDCDAIIVIADNWFVNNSGVTVLFDCPTVVVQHNFFENTAAQYNLKVRGSSISYSGKVVNASLNYWGIDDAGAIPTTIYDNDYDSSLLDIIYRPYLGSKNVTDIRDDDVSFIRSSGEIGGPVNGDIVLALSGSPFKVVSNIEVKESDHLTVESGVMLTFEASFVIKVLGVLNVTGTTAQPVVMKAIVPGAQWKGLEIKGNFTSSLVNLIVNDTIDGIVISGYQVSMHNVTSNFSINNGITISVKYQPANFSKVIYSGLMTFNNTKTGIAINLYDSVTNSTSVQINGCSVFGNKGNGMTIQANARVSLYGCEVIKNARHGLYINQGQGGVTNVQSSIFDRNMITAVNVYDTVRFVLNSSVITNHDVRRYWKRDSAYIQFKTEHQKKETVIISSNKFENNTAKGITFMPGGDIFLDIYNNTFVGGNRIVKFQKTSDSSFPCEIRFTQNHVCKNSYQTLIEIDAGYALGILNITGNVFTKNSALRGIVVSNALMRIALEIVIDGNMFLFNRLHEAMIDIVLYPKARIHHNIFKNDATTCELQAPFFRNSTFYLNATLNYWGSRRISTVINKVCGFDKQMDRAFVYYMPFYSDDTLSRLEEHSHNVFDIVGGSGGEITTAKVLSEFEFSTANIVISRSIMIRNGSRLTVVPGMTLSFESGRGIYVAGGLSLVGEGKTVNLTTSDDTWYGIVVNSKTDLAIISNTVVQNTKHGVVVETGLFELRRSVIRYSTTNCLKMQFGLDTIHDFQDTLLQYCSEAGVKLSEQGNITIANLTIENARSGISSQSKYGNLIVMSSFITNIEDTAVSAAYGTKGNVLIENCVISNCHRGIIFVNNYENNTIKVSKNLFRNVSFQAVIIDLSSKIPKTLKRTVDIGYNTFQNSCLVHVIVENHDNLSFHDNTIYSSSCIRNGFVPYYLDITAETNIYTTNRMVDISSNLFNNVSATYIVRLRGSSVDHFFYGTFHYNQFLDNKATQGIVLLDTKHLNLSQNIFDSPQSLFDFYVVEQGSDIINASHNWWGSPNIEHAYSRIFDGRQQYDLLTLNITPVLTERNIDCSGINNCNSNGECISKDICRCHSGWRGETCSEYDCAGVNYCYGNGNCTGPNQCQCFAGWSGQLCIDASCSNINDCSGHGICVRPDMCTCAQKFTGSNCDSCVENHWGPFCQPCPACVNGVCDLNTGQCICNGKNWTGSLCDRCNETFYGPHCPVMIPLTAIPSEVLHTWGNLVHIWGHNFPKTKTSSYKCKFGTDIVNATWVALNHVTCRAPQHAEGIVALEISADGVTYTNSMLIYTFYTTCPPGSCGKTFTHPHGQCLFGGCSCNLPWVGESCEREVLAPKIRKPMPQENVSESGIYTYSLNLNQGEPPVRWELKKGPNEMTINERTATLEWQHAFARITPYQIRVTASNLVGFDTAEWEIVVQVSYQPDVRTITPTGDLPLPKSITISGVVTFADPRSARVVPVEVMVKNDLMGQKLLQTLTNPLAPTTFTITYNPRPDDAGVFNVVAQHPAGTKGTTTLSWRVKGMRCDPAYVSWNGIIDGNLAVYENMSMLMNTGGISINNISAQVDGLPGAHLRQSGTTTSSQPFLTQLPEDGRQEFDLTVTDPRPLSGTIYVIFTSAEGLTIRMRVHIRLSVRMPLLVFSPSSLSENINRESQKVIDIVVLNKGEVSAWNVGVDLPNDARISLVAFAVVNNKTIDASSQTTDLALPPNGKAVLTIALTVGPLEVLGEMSGRIAVNTNLTTGYISYKFYITSLQTLTLNVTVTDEYTYFASEKPTVAGARVLLKNPRRNYNEERITTNVTDSVQFDDIYEDKYTLHVEAQDHSSYSAVIIASPDNVNFEAFLKRIAVKYDWTVTQTTVQDVYIITLESTFETFVPMPVVTIEPVKVNTIPYELGQKETIEFTITNHGLIRADNLRFALPTSHPYLIFESTIDFIGHLEANMTIVVPVRTVIRPLEKRNLAALTICGLVMLYDLDCGGLQTYSRDVTLTREYPGTPPLPCGLIGGGGGVAISYSGTGRESGSGTVVSYNPVTPLSCDCAKTLIRRCALAFHPIAGCEFAIGDLAKSFSDRRTGGSLVLGALNAILGLADTAFTCVFGVACNLCGLFYTSVRCAVDVHFNCGGSRRRREVSTDVVNNVLHVAQPMDNFLSIMEEILGDKNMYNIGRQWYGSFKKAVSDESENGFLLSITEVANVLSVLTNEANRQTLAKFLLRWNNTAAAWDNGTLNKVSDTRGVINLSRLSPRFEQYLNDLDAAQDKGFNSLFDEFDHALNAYNTAEQESKKTRGEEDNPVCAKVQLRIVQKVVFTGDAFTAKLKIENGRSSALEDIHVEIQIRQTYGTGELANEKFSIGTPKLIGVTGVNETGSLGHYISGTAEWLIIPNSSAAPVEDTLYDIGGRLSYRVGSSKFSVPLLPDILTVKSNPSLVVHYFHEKYVRGDDPLTTEVEPIVPFSLCVLVMNAAYGVANALKITSGQPEIIENEKGLLISFKIIGAQLGNNSISPSLTVNFGDIVAFETKTACWLLTSTLKGAFYNYSATFENINPLGDPQLSLLDELRYHELIHLVRLDNSDDELDDFLVNDFIDPERIPDRVYNSANGTDVYEVTTAKVTAVSDSNFVRSGSKAYTIIHLIVDVQNGSYYHYIRVENNITSPFPQDNQYLIHANREDGRELLVDKNAWQTTYVFDTFYIHLFDNSENISDSEKWTYMSYNLTFGPRNMYPPKFNAPSYSATMPKGSQSGRLVLKLEAYDIDKDAFTFSFVNYIFQTFTIEQNTGEIHLIRTVSEPRTYQFEVEVKDQGVPSKSSTAMVSVTISGYTWSTTTVASSTVSQSTTSSTSLSPSIANISSHSTSISTASETSFSVSTFSQSTMKSSVSTSDKSTTKSLTASSTKSTAESSVPTSTKSTTKFSVSPSSTRSPNPSSAVNAKADEHKDLQSWVVPTAIGGGVYIVLVIVVVVFVYMVLKKANTGTMGRHRSRNRARTRRREWHCLR